MMYILLMFTFHIFYEEIIKFYCFIYIYIFIYYGITVNELLAQEAYVN